jgi:dolichol-phosphate mannosyltransferase
VDLAWRTNRAGLKIVEVPITFVERELGVSKMTGRIVREAVVNVGRWGSRHRVRQLGDRLSRRRG